jgi:hypothetical protein
LRLRCWQITPQTEKLEQNGLGQSCRKFHGASFCDLVHFDWKLGAEVKPENLKNLEKLSDQVRSKISYFLIEIHGD